MKTNPSRDAILSVGRIYCDLVFAGVPSMPQMGREVFAQSMQPVLGGGAFIAAAHLVQLERPVALLASYGIDPLSLALEPQLDASGIELTFVERSADAGPQVTVVITAPNDRAFLSRRAGKAVPGGFEAALGWERAALLHIAEYATLAEQPDLVARAKAHGLLVSLDPSWDDSLISDPRLISACAGVDVFLPNAEEALAITGTATIDDALNSLAESFPLVVVKCGGKGAVLAAGTTRLSIPAPKVNVVDPTGAGDAFNAGFLDAYLRERPLPECLAAGIAAGSRSVQSIGGAPVSAHHFADRTG